MNELRLEFEEMLEDLCVEYGIELSKDFVAELFSQSLEVFGDCGAIEEEE